MLISQRGNQSHLSYGAWNEAEDVLAACGGGEIRVLDRDTRDNSVRVRRIVGRGVRRIAGARTTLPATVREPTPTGDHVFFIAHGLWDLPLLERLRGLRRAGVSISVWISEVWPSELQDPRVKYECYSMVDHIFVAMDEAAERMAELVPSANVHTLRPAVDVFRFASLEAVNQRPIAVLGIGRRDRQQHAKILDWSRRNHVLYVYDTVHGQAHDWREHREALADLYRHSGIAICNYAKHDLPEVTGGFRIIPGRVFEALASGTILVGLAPDERQQRELFGRLVVEDLEQPGAELTEVLERFHDEAVAKPLRDRNFALACRGHDWSHRWKVVFETIGQPVPAALQARIDSLARSASLAEMSAKSTRSDSTEHQLRRPEG